MGKRSPAPGRKAARIRQRSGILFGLKDDSFGTPDSKKERPILRFPRRPLACHGFLHHLDAAHSPPQQHTCIQAHVILPPERYSADKYRKMPKNLLPDKPDEPISLLTSSHTSGCSSDTGWQKSLAKYGLAKRRTNSKQRLLSSGVKEALPAGALGG